VYGGRAAVDNGPTMEAIGRIIARMLHPDKMREYLAQHALANEYEVQELRATPVETKLRQLWSLMQSKTLFEDEAQRQADSQIARERWALIYRALGV